MTPDTDRPQPDAVACAGLVHAFGETRAVDGLDLTVRQGEVFGLLGLNGSGKTTAIRCLTTLLPVPAGTVRVFGHDAAGDRMAVRRLLGYVPQQLSADAGLTGRENVALFARVFDVPRRERAQRVAQALTAVGLADAVDRLAATCSGGMVRRLELAQALVSVPRLLILDEPTIGLDPIARTGVWQHIGAVRAATGMTVLVRWTPCAGSSSARPTTWPPTSRCCSWPPPSASPRPRPCWAVWPVDLHSWK
ncbi:ATP-binding cassette domain-containing protein [Streptomyces coeruleorubidus]|uniref:ATP-binding cassette domain-containing protein n=1 Tax=Streptomyces coeruleorubidus TaxID=116188 RepID=UPI00364E30CF